MATNPATTYATPMTHIIDPSQGFAQAQPVASPQQQVPLIHYAGTAPQQPHTFPPIQYAVHPVQQGAVAPGMNVTQVPQMSPAKSQYKTAAPVAALGRAPAPVDCPSCGKRALTATNFIVGNTTHGWAGALCCLFCLGFISYMMNDTKDVEHKCGQCGITLATWHRSGNTEIQYHG